MVESTAGGISQSQNAGWVLTNLLTDRATSPWPGAYMGKQSPGHTQDTRGLEVALNAANHWKVAGCTKPPSYKGLRWSSAQLSHHLSRDGQRS